MAIPNDIHARILALIATVLAGACALALGIEIGKNRRRLDRLEAKHHRCPACGQVKPR